MRRVYDATVLRQNRARIGGRTPGKPVNELKARDLASPELNANPYAVSAQLRALEELLILLRRCVWVAD